MRAPFVVFDRYTDYGIDGPMLEEVAPKLADRLLFSTAGMNGVTITTGFCGMVWVRSK